MIESTFSPLPEHPLPAPKILIVEYDGAVRASIVEGLKAKKRHRIYEASSLFAASQQLRTQVIDTLVLGYVNEKNIIQNGDLEEWLTKVISKVKRLILLTAESFNDPYMTLSFWTQEEIRSLIEQLPRSDLSKNTLSQHSLDQTPWAHMQTPLTEPDLNIDTPIAPNTTHLYGRGHTTLQTSPATDIRSQSSSNHDEDQRDPPPAYWAEVSYCERPMRAKAIAHISSVAFEEGARHIVEDSLDAHPKEEEGSLILWVGPSDDSLCKDLKRACQPLNFNLLITESAQQALKETRTRRFEVAFVYSHLSDMMGLSLVRSLRREVGEGLPIAFITPSRQASDRVEAVHAGVSLFLNEAASVDLLTQSLRQLQSLGTHGSAKILVIDDDNAELGDHVTRELSHSTFQVSCLTSPLRVLELLAEVQTDLLIIHADMAGLGGFEVCRTLRATPEWQSLPILLMGERSDEDIRIAAYKSGADDYLSSNADQTVLRACLEARLERSRMIQERADRDGLTGLLVRRAFNDALLSRMAAARRRGTSVAVCLLDLDHFKSINDTYGHIAGDRVGRGERLFLIFKFRTMKVGSEQKIGKRLVQKNEGHYTSVGHFLRKYRLDEFPQLINVIKGEMALVGPRPVRPIFLEDHQAHISGYTKRFLVKPGITGLAQVRGGYYTSPRHKLLYDLLYIANRSLFFDLKLITLTFLRVMTKILTLTFVLTWILLATLALPEDVQGIFYVQTKLVHVNVLYLILPIFLFLKILIQGVEKNHLYALKTPVDLWIVSIIILGIIGIYLSHHPHPALRGLLWYICNAFIPFYLCINTTSVRQRPRQLLSLLIIICGIAAGVELLQVLIEGIGEQRWRRVGGGLGEPLWLSAVGLMILPPAMVIWWGHRTHTPPLHPFSVKVFNLCILLIGIAFVSTGSRAGFLCLSCITIGWLKGNNRYIVWGILFLSVLIFWVGGDHRFTPQHTLNALHNHTTHQSKLLRDLEPERLLIGVGARSAPIHLLNAQRTLYGEVKYMPILRSTPTTLLVEYGIFGLLCFILMITRAITLILREGRRRKDHLLSAIGYGLFAASLLSMICDLWFPFSLSLLFWSLLGVGVGVALEGQRGPKRAYRMIHAHAPL